MKKILITGSSGFFGKSIVSRLLKSEESFQCVCLSKNSQIQINDSRFSVLTKDILDINGMDRLFEELKPTHFVHFAWYVTPQQFWKAEENIEWLYASSLLFHKFCKHGGSVFIGAGTMAEYDENCSAINEETTPVIPNSLYAQSKKSLYDIICKIRDDNGYGTRIIWPRIGYFFGENEPKQKLISKLICAIKNSCAIDLVSRKFSRPYAHVRYLADIITKILFMQNNKDLVFALSAEHGYTMESIVEFIAKCFKKRVDCIKYGAYSSCGFKQEVVSVEAKFLRESLGMDIRDTFWCDLENMIAGLQI